ncbi:MAG: PfkB family carbohydrate kinase [Acidimicrobiales bacterium]|nr:PfkB family carbohydrate kinase [Acidimicrobiales bacterium]
MSAASPAPTPGRVVTVTANAAVDHTVVVPGFRAGEVNRVASEVRNPGGKGVNVAAALRMLGVDVVVTGFLGAGNDELFTEFFATEGIEDRFVRVDGATRTGIKIVDDAGTTTDLNLPGSRVSGEDVDRLVATVGELAEPFDLTHQAVSRHVGILRRCGLIRQRVDGQRRPCRLDAARMEELAGWISEQQREWESRLDRLDEHLAAVQVERSR